MIVVATKVETFSLYTGRTIVGKSTSLIMVYLVAWLLFLAVCYWLTYKMPATMGPFPMLLRIVIIIVVLLYLLSFATGRVWVG